MKHLLQSLPGMGIKKAIRMIYACLFNLELKGDPHIRISPTANGYSFTFRSDPAASAGSPEVYHGWFTVANSSSGLTIRNGFDSSDTFAGYALYNNRPVHCPVGRVQASSGFLCLQIDNSHTVSYAILSDFPGMPILTSSGGSTQTSFPLAQIVVTSGRVDIFQIFRYGIPILQAWGPCDEGTAS